MKSIMKRSTRDNVQLNYAIYLNIISINDGLFIAHISSNANLE
ncbi:hypothetical protein OTUT144_0512 [Orientia tsutsugamushi str. UT144]|uniref:Uncharacterized protein n=1 Tax=Orientia tsutsugamushi str. UT144 TaxID=1441384 RepID=A0A0F3RQM1_ORITS|nr:hypothetical protein OTUT144_0512 [Orientia tsutsugamushi str. UT144]